MTDKEYLEAIIREQTIAQGSEEFKALQDQRAKVEKILREYFGSSPAIREGGSKAKHTMIRESYDLDILCYFLHDEENTGSSLKEIYNNVFSVLSDSYIVERKRSALRLMDRDDHEHYTHLDVIPGRYADETKQDVYLHQENGEKERLKTNPEIHINHVRDSGVRDAIKLIKLWKVRNHINAKTFVLELLVIKLLQDKREVPLTEQLSHIWAEFRDNNDNLTVDDPANPEGNDLSELLNDSVITRLSSVASNTLKQIEEFGWSAVYGAVKEDAESLSDRLREVASTRSVRPWSSV